ncbi:MAG TPA: hypothetical protein VD833_04685 [Vicinamibacterales bacterium]|nr:hypothetical protein [Vicinamibacterales bacterium]
MPLRRIALLGALALVVLTLVHPSAQAPKPPADAPQLLLLTFQKVRPGMGPRYVELQTKEVMPAQKKGGLAGRQVWSSGLSGPVGEFVFISPIPSMAQFDDSSPMVKALGQEGAAALNAKVRELAEPQGTSIVRTRPDLHYELSPGGPPPPLAVVTIVEVVPGKRTEFEAFLKKDVIPAMQKAKAHSYAVVEVLYGENTGGYITAIGMDSYATIGKGHPFQIALGEDGARKLEGRAFGIVSKITRFISRYRPELSWSAQSTS